MVSAPHILTQIVCINMFTSPVCNCVWMYSNSSESIHHNVATCGAVVTDYSTVRLKMLCVLVIGSSSSAVRPALTSPSSLHLFSELSENCSQLVVWSALFSCIVWKLSQDVCQILIHIDTLLKASLDLIQLITKIYMTFYDMHIGQQNLAWKSAVLGNDAQ